MCACVWVWDVISIMTFTIYLFSFTYCHSRITINLLPFIYLVPSTFCLSPSPFLPFLSGDFSWINVSVESGLILISFFAVFLLSSGDVCAFWLLSPLSFFLVQEDGECLAWVSGWLSENQWEREAFECLLLCILCILCIPCMSMKSRHCVWVKTFVLVGSLLCVLGKLELAIKLCVWLWWTWWGKEGG